MSSLSINAGNVLSAMPGEGGSSQEIGVTMLKKAMDIDQQAAAQLLQALPAPAPAGTNNPAHLGKTVDTHA